MTLFLEKYLSNKMEVLLKVLKYKYKYILTIKADIYDLTMSHIHLGHLFHLITFAVNTMYLPTNYISV